MSRSLQKNRLFLNAKPALGILAVMGLTALSGCDTVARISFPDVKFDRVEVAGINPPAGSCQGASDTAKLRFILLDNQKQPISPETTLNGQVVSLTKDNLEFSNSAIFSTPDVLCSSGSCAQSDFECKETQVGFEARCVQTGELSAKAPIFKSSLDANQLFGVVMQNTGSLQGSLPSNVVNARSYDFDGDGLGDTIGSLAGVDRDRATDQLGFRFTGMTQMAATWKLVEQFSSKNNQVQNFFGLWTFANSPGSITSVIGNDVWTSSPSAVDAAVGRYTAMNNPDKSQASVLESIITILKDTEAYANPTFTDYEKVMVVFVDGPDELRLKSQTAAEVIAAANAVNAKLFIVHLDAKVPVERNGEPLFVDDAEYIKSQDPCMDTSECKNFETCREITKYSSTPGGAATFPEKATAGTKFCLPERDDNGRFGPIDDYAEIACATGGSYIYVKENRSLLTEMTWLPYTLDGLWEADVNVDLFSRDMVADEEPYLLETTMSVQLGEVRAVKPINQKGNIGTDNRLVLFKQ